jgi:hypothetical protein
MEVGLDHLRFSGEASPESFVLGCNSYGTGIEVALPRHDASDGKEGGGSESKLVRSQKSCNDDIARKLEPSIHTQTDSIAQAGFQQ